MFSGVGPFSQRLNVAVNHSLTNNKIGGSGFVDLTKFKYLIQLPAGYPPHAAVEQMMLLTLRPNFEPSINHCSGLQCLAS